MLQQTAGQASDAATTTITDFNPVVLENARHNIGLNGLLSSSSSPVDVAQLDFYEQTGESFGTWRDGDGKARPSVNVVLAADIICQPDDAKAAARTIHDALCIDDGVAIVVCADSKHRYGVDCLEEECAAVGLSVETTHNFMGNLKDDHFELTAGYVQGMTLTKFVVRHQKPRR